MQYPWDPNYVVSVSMFITEREEKQAIIFFNCCPDNNARDPPRPRLSKIKLLSNFKINLKQVL